MHTRTRTQLFAFFCCAMNNFASSSTVFLESPPNTAVYDKESLTLACAANVTSEAVMMSWKFTQFGIAEEKTIYNGVEASPEFNRFKIRNGGHRSYLEMEEVRLTDAGVYECGIFVSQSNVREKSAAQLIVIAAEPNCSVPSHPSGSYVEGEEVSLKCELTYKGSWAPVMHWKQIDGPVLVTFVEDLSKENNLISYMRFVLNSSCNGSKFVCDVFFDQTMHHPSFTTNIPRYNFNWTFTIQDIKYGPRGINIHPEKISYHPGNVVTCSAHADPPPDYEWTNVQTGVRTFGPELFIYDTIVPDRHHTFRCTAKNEHGNASREFDLNILKSDSNGGNTLVITSTVVTTNILTVLAVIGFIFIRKRTNSNRNLPVDGQTTGEVPIEISSEIRHYEEILDSTHTYVNVPVSDAHGRNANVIHSYTDLHPVNSI